MEEATVDTGTAEAQSMETESQATETSATQAAPKAAGTPDIKALLKRDKEDPNVQFTDAELDALEKHWESGEKPKADKAPEPEKDEDEEEGDKPEPKAKPEKEEEGEPEEAEEAEPDTEAKAILKELGAKNLKDAAAKLKGLKALVGGKDAQAVAKLTREKEEIVNGGKALWQALAKNDPQAIAFAEKSFGVKFGGQKADQPVSTGDRYIDPAKFIDPESADLVEAAFVRQAQELKTLKDQFGVITQERDRHIQDTQAKQSRMSVVDEMTQIASRIDGLKGITGFREAAQAVLDGKPDSRLDVFAELFDIAEAEKCSLKAAFDIKRGRDSDLREALAVEKGRKEAYNQKPNPSLSGIVGGKGEMKFQPVTDADLERWEADYRTHPTHWYDKEGDLIESMVPKRARSLFGIKS